MNGTAFLISMILLCMTAFLATAGLIWFIERRAKKKREKAENYDPSQAKAELPDVPMRSLDATLSYMRGRVMVVIWDLMCGIFWIPFAFVYIGETKYYDAMVRNNLCMGAILVGGHIIFTIYYNFHSYRKRMIKYTKRYIDIENPETYCEVVEQNFKEQMIYRSKMFVLSRDYVLGLTGFDSIFHPAAIPICMIASARFYQEHISGRRGRDIGILSCTLKNGAQVVFYTSVNEEIIRVRRVLDYYRFPCIYR